jgi:hypothetical protein
MRGCAGFAIVALLIACVQAVSDRAASPPRNVALTGPWELVSCDPSAYAGTLNVTDFTVMLRWNEDARRQLPATMSSATPRSVADALALARELVKPPVTHVAVAKRFLASVASYCDDAVVFDAIRCRNVPVALVNALLPSDNPLCLHQHARRRSAHVLRARRAVRGGIDHPVEIQLITDLVLSGATGHRPRRHRHRRPNQTRTAGTTTSGGKRDDWPLGRSPAPVIIGVDMSNSTPSLITTVYVALHCLNGDVTDGGIDGKHRDYHAWCKGDHELPKTLDISSTSNTATTVSVDVEHRCTSDWLPPKDSDPAMRKAVTCQVDVTTLFTASLPASALWSLATFQATVTFTDGDKRTAWPEGFYDKQYNDVPVYYPVVRTVVPDDLRRQYEVPLPNPPSNPAVSTAAAASAGSGSGSDSSSSSDSQTLASAATGAPPLPVGVVEFSDTTDPGQGISLQDLADFLNYDRSTSTLIRATNVTVAQLQSDLIQFIGNQSTMDTDETSLDIQWLMALAEPSTKVTLWNVENGPGLPSATYPEAFVKWSNDVISPTGPVAAAPPSVWSISYCGPEWPDMYDNGDQLTDMLNRNFELLSASGVTVVAASGDWGAVWDADTQPYAAYALYPASAPHVLAVGGTSFKRTSPTVVDEVACQANDGHEITSSGGFSVNFEVPSYQSAAVNAYIAKQPSAISSNVYLYPPGMRAVPDVAALASELLLVTGGVRSMIYGTSGAAPIVAAFVSLANNAKSRAQQHTGTGIAQIHAMLYGQNNVILRDVTVGDNCPGEQYGQWIANFPDFGTTCYNASVGWDAVTGLGTLNVTRLVELAATWVAPPPPPTPTPTPRPPASTAAPGTPRPPTPPPTPKPKAGPPHTHAPVDNSDSSSSSCSGSNATDDDDDDDPHAKSKTTVYVACAASIGGCIVIVMATIFLRRRADARRRAMAVAGGGGVGSATPFVAPDEEARTAADSVAPYTPVASASPLSPP